VKRASLAMAALLVAAGVVIAGCSQAAPAPTAAPAKPAAAPTSAPAAAPAPTKAPAAAPTAAPAAKVDFPQKGKSITVIVPFSAGGGTDTQARIIAASMEKTLGVPVQVVDKPGAGSQVGLTELVNAKPDGYTIGFTNNPTTMGVYLTPDRKATFNKSSFAPIAGFVFDPEDVVVKAGGPYNTMKDLIDAAKAKPKTIKATTNGLLSDDHMAIIQVEQTSGAQFAIVHFDGASEEVTALLGDKTDAAFMGVGTSLPFIKQGQLKALMLMDKAESPFLPGVPTAASLGYNIVIGSSRGLSAPKGTPPEIIAILANAIKKATEDPEVKQKLTDMGSAVNFQDTQTYDKFWSDMEVAIKPVMDIALKESKN